MNIRCIILCLIASCSQLVMAQVLRSPGLTMPTIPAYEAARTNLNPSDQITLARADRTRNNLEASLKDYLVAYDSQPVVFDSQRLKERYRVGLPLASFVNNQVDVAYDLSGKNVMAQWRFGQSATNGQRFDYQAYMGASGTVSLVLRSRF